MTGSVKGQPADSKMLVADDPWLPLTPTNHRFSAPHKIALSIIPDYEVLEVNFSVLQAERRIATFVCSQ